MSESLIKKLNAITHGNLSDPMVVRMDNWNSAMDEVRAVLAELTAARDEAEKLRGRVSELEQSAQQLICSGTGPLADLYDNYPTEVVVLRKQAESVERLASHCSIKSMSGNYIWKEAAIEEATRLRNQADELESKS